jgi:hypothetical protein
MIIIQPFVKLQEDNEKRIMARSGAIVGFSRTRAVWRFGFLPGSDSAQAHGIAADEFLFVLADYRGEILATFNGFALNLPKRFKKVIDSSI